MNLFIVAMLSPTILASSTEYSNTPATAIDPARETCLSALQAELGEGGRKRIASADFQARKAPGSDARRVHFVVVMHTRDGVPSRYSGFCGPAPDRPAAVRLKEAESFGRF